MPGEQGHRLRPFCQRTPPEPPRRVLAPVPPATAPIWVAATVTGVAATKFGRGHPLPATGDDSAQGQQGAVVRFVDRTGARVAPGGHSWMMTQIHDAPASGQLGSGSVEPVGSEPLKREVERQANSSVR